MSDRADLVQGDELQNGFQTAESSDDRPPSRHFRSYDRQAIGHMPSSEPPAYCESATGGKMPKYPQQQQQQQYR